MAILKKVVFEITDVQHHYIDEQARLQQRSRSAIVRELITRGALSSTTFDDKEATVLLEHLESIRFSTPQTKNKDH